MKQRILHALIFFAVTMVTCFSVRAESPSSLPNPEGAYSLTILYTFTDESRTIPLDGAEIKIVQVAKVSVTGGHLKYVPLYGGSADYLDMTAEESEAAARRLAEKTRNSASAFKAVSDADGSVVFRNLKPGMYLVEETGSNGTAASYEVFRPFLVSVPGYEVNANGQVIVYDAIASPKAERKQAVVIQRESSSVQSVSRVNTGDEVQTVPWFFLLQCSIAITVWSFITLKWGANENAQ